MPGVIAVLITICLLLSAQQPFPQKDVNFTSSSNLVIIDVTVRDKSGKEVSTLKKDDFVILEDGQPQKLSVFEFQKLNDTTAAPAEPPPPPKIADAAPAARAQQITATPGRIQYQDRRLTVLLFAFSSTPIPDHIP